MLSAPLWADKKDKMQLVLVSQLCVPFAPMKTTASPQEAANEVEEAHEQAGGATAASNR